MRVLIVVHGFPPAAQGGSEIYAYAHARTLRESFGDDVFVLTREADPSRPEYEVRSEKRGGLRIAWINNTFRSARTFEETYTSPAIAAIAGQVLDEFKPDVAHVHHLTCLSTAIVSALRARNIPCFVTLHDYWLICHRGQLLDTHIRVCDGPDKHDPQGCADCVGAAGSLGSAGFTLAPALRAVERTLPERAVQFIRATGERAVRASGRNQAQLEETRRRMSNMRSVCADVTRFFAPSTHMRNRFVEFGIPADRIAVSRYGFDRRGFQAATHTSSGPLRLGFVGSLMASKAPHILLEAASRLPPGSVTVELFGSFSAYHGDDSYRRQLEPLLALPGVQLHGPVPHDQIPERLATIDALVVPSIWPENSPLVIHEAFLAGVPVVASRIGGIPELVTDGVNGLLFKAGEVEDLVRILLRVQENRGLLQSLRAGIPSVRSIEDDVRSMRSVYGPHVGRDRSSVTARPDRQLPSLAAVVLNFGAPDDTLLAVKSLLASARPVDNLIVVDNDRSFAGREVLPEGWPAISYVPTERNLGFSGGINIGIREALKCGTDRVLLMNSDVVVPPDCIDRLEDFLNRRPDVGVVGPVVRSRSAPDRVATCGMSYSAATGRMRHSGVGAPTTMAPDHAIVDGVSGCLMLIRHEVFDAIGLLDEEYFFGFEDLDFCLRAAQAGCKTAIVGDAFAYHEGGRSIGAASPRRLYFAARNHLRMADRHGRAAGSVPRALRTCSVIALNVAHAIISPGGTLPARLGAVGRGVGDYVAGRFGAGPDVE
jgi:GT2 family glycosyltransferase/glycosyltransferase involved in cell wall biosynthesis